MSANPIVAPAAAPSRETRQFAVAFVVMLALIAVAPFVAYPFFVMQALCFALFACAFNLLIGYVGLLSLGHAMFLGAASYVCAHAAKVWGLDPVSGDPRRRRLFGDPRLRRRRAVDPQPGHLFRHDHGGAVADDLSSSASRRRSPTARTASRACRRAAPWG